MNQTKEDRSLDPITGRLAIYYGCADTVPGLAFAKLDEVLAFTKANSLSHDR